MTDEIKRIVLVGPDSKDCFPKTYGSLVQNANGDTLENVEAGAQVNKIEKVKIGDAEQTINTSTKTVTLDVYTKSQTDSAISTAVAGKANSADVYLKTETYSKTELDGKLSSAYKAAGSAANVAGLGALDAAHEGFVYNMTAQFTTTADFVEGAGKKHPAGTNVAIVNVGNAETPSYKYDVLAGFVDTSDYDTHIADSDIHVTAAQKTDWSEKQDAIADLDTIRSGAAAGATAVQPAAISDMATKTWVGNQGFLTQHQDISGKADKATTLAGYGITDAYTTSAADAKFLTIANGLSYRELA